MQGGIAAFALVASVSAWAGMTPEEIRRWGDVEYAQPVRPGNPEPIRYFS